MDRRGLPIQAPAANRDDVFHNLLHRLEIMQTTDAKNIFRPYQPPLGEYRRHAVALDFDAQVFATVETWALEHELTFAVLLDRVVTEIAGELIAATHPNGTAARTLRILDLDRLIDLIDGSIRPARAACGNLCPSAYPQAAPAHAPADQYADRSRYILSYYTALTGNRLKPADYVNVKLVLDLPDLVIQAGILHALNYATRPVGSFAYCVRAMENFLDPSIDLAVTCATLIDKLLRKRATGQLVLPLAGEKLLIGEFQNDD